MAGARILLLPAGFPQRRHQLAMREKRGEAFLRRHPRHGCGQRLTGLFGEPGFHGVQYRTVRHRLQISAYSRASSQVSVSHSSSASGSPARTKSRKR